MPTTRTVDVPGRILAEATRLFAEQGFDGTSLQSIADAVGIRKSSLLYHYRSKHDLHQSVLRQMITHWNEALPRLLAAATSGQGRFDTLVRELVAFFTADPFRARLLARELLDRPVEMRKMMNEHVGPWIGFIADYVRRGQERGMLQSEVDPEAYVMQMIVLVVSSVAVLDCAGVMDTDKADGRGGARRFLDETLRIARRSLFCDEQGGVEAKARGIPRKAR